MRGLPSPSVMILDEPASALMSRCSADSASVKEEQREREISYVFILATRRSYRS